MKKKRIIKTARICMLAKEKLNEEQEMLTVNALPKRKSLFRKKYLINRDIIEFRPAFKELCKEILTEDSPMSNYDEIDQKLDKYLEINHEL